jgi:divalent metal cation (Fe/Co/Zn/Cd) transporter
VLSDDSFDPTVVRAARRLSEASIAWTLVGSSLAVAIGVGSGSSALVAFGLVGYVDLAGSVALVHHFRHALGTEELSDRFEQRAHRIVTVGLLAIGIATIVVSALRLAGGHHPKTTGAGIAVAAVSLVGLSVLAVCKVRVARRVPSAALRSDGHLSGVGAAQGAVVLLGTGASRLFSWSWADDSAAIVVGAAAVAIAAATLLRGAGRRSD